MSNYPFIEFRLTYWGETSAEMQLYATPSGTLAGADEPVLIGRRRFAPNPRGINAATTSLAENELHEHLYNPNAINSYTVVADKAGSPWNKRSYAAHRTSCGDGIKWSVGLHERHTFISRPAEYAVLHRIFDFFGGGEPSFDEPEMFGCTEFHDCCYDSTFAPLFVEEN